VDVVGSRVLDALSPHGEHGEHGRVRVSVERARMIGNKPYLRTMLTWRHFAAEETKGGLLAATDASRG
jgi:hypothetical protein